MGGVRNCVICVKLLIFLFVRPATVTDFQMPKYTISSLCGSHMNLKWRNIYTAELSLSTTNVNGPFSPPYNQIQSCDVTVESWDFLNKLMVRFEEFDINRNCSDTSVEVLDGIEDVKSIEGLPRPICGHHRETVMSGSFVTTDKFMTIRVRGNRSSNVRMKIYITAFHDGTCRSYEYPCSNSRCIIEDLSCNGYNPCGDNSDCPLLEAPQEVEVDSHPVFFATIIAVSVSVVLVVIGLVVLIRCYTLRRKRRRQEYERPSDFEERSTHHVRNYTSVGNYQRSESQIEAERRYAPPSYNSLPVHIEQEPEEDGVIVTATEGDDEPCNEVTFYSDDNPQPPAYKCVMKYQDMFRVSQTDISVETANEVGVDDAKTDDKT